MRPAYWIGLVAFLLAGTPAFGDISGKVADGNVERVGGVLLTIQGTNTRTVSDENGDFVFEGDFGEDVVVVAALAGHFNGSELADDGDDDLDIRLDFIPDVDDEEYEFADSSDCGFCHENHEAEWSDSPMGNTGNNTWVYDVFNGTGTIEGDDGFVYTDDSVQREAFPEGECAACHQPAHWVESGGDVGMSDIDDPSDAAVASVTCDICHKIEDVRVDKIMWPGIQEGVVTVYRPDSDQPEQVLFGVRGDVDFVDENRMRASYNPLLVAEVCGVCHEDTNDPTQDRDFDIENAVPVQTTYSEWKESKYGDPESDDYQSCADCHMPEADEDDNELCNAIFPPLLRPANHRHYHNIRGTSEAFLENSVTMEMTTEVVNREVVVNVDITNDQTGHDAPGGNPFRHMVLLVEVTIGDTELVHTGDQLLDKIAGEGEYEDGEWEGRPGKVFARILEDEDGDFPVFYTESVAEKYDTRIPVDATDSTEYSFAIPLEGGDIDVRARLIYRKAMRDMLAKKAWTVDGHGNPLADIEEPHFGVLMEECNDALTVGPAPQFIRGDVDGSGELDCLVDAMVLLAWGFQNGDAPPCLDAADVDDNGIVQPLTDVVNFLDYCFTNGAPPPSPGPEVCGVDPTPDGTDCADPSACE